MKSKKEKQKLITELREVPIVQVACQKTGISRATFYRWKKRDKKFAQKAEEAIFEGALFINDLAESQLISAIKEQNMKGIVFWLKHHHPIYTNKLEITGHLEHSEKELTTNQKKIIKEALKLACIKNNERRKNNKKNNIR